MSNPVQTVVQGMAALFAESLARGQWDLAGRLARAAEAVIEDDDYYLDLEEEETT